MDNDPHAEVQHIFNRSLLKSKCSNAFKIFFCNGVGGQFLWV